MPRYGLFLLLLLLCLSAETALAATNQPFSEWLAGFRVEALGQGISEATVHNALDGIEPNRRAIELDHKQPEKISTFAFYRQHIVSKKRIQEGRRMLAQYADELNKASRTYGVAPQYIVALWGMETSFGKNTGGFEIIPSLTTLAWEGRREAFFKQELLDALVILDQGHIAPDDMKGSWAGAMGQNQFMPSSFLKFAADGDGDGRKNIWTDHADVFASTANYLARNGWKDGQRWGRQVVVPDEFKPTMVSLKTHKSLKKWSELGIELPNGRPLPVEDNIEASLVAPDGLRGPTYLVYDNYRAIMRWNRSTYFATAAGLLADAIAAGKKQ